MTIPPQMHAVTICGADRAIVSKPYPGSDMAHVHLFRGTTPAGHVTFYTRKTLQVCRISDDEWDISAGDIDQVLTIETRDLDVSGWGFMEVEMEEEAGEHPSVTIPHPMSL